LEVSEIVDAIYRSSMTGAAVRLDRIAPMADLIDNP
jgi:hypothetical protein